MATTKNSENPDNIADPIQNPVQVFCRLRALKTSDICSAQLRNLTTLVFPFHGNRVQSKPNAVHETHYVFKQVFNEAATQADIFNVVARPLVERLIRGCNSLLFTYGVTGSGKTYTMTGIQNQCGILPRCLRTLFQTIAGYNAGKGTFQSDHLNGFEISTEPEIKPIKSARNITHRRKNSEPDFNLESMGPILPVSGINEHSIYAVFVSYVEIYNNSVYDLFEGGASQKVPQSHIVREDGNHNMYINGAIELEVSSVQEALEAFQIGQKRKSMGQTALNNESSRSHTVFNIRLVQAPSKKYASFDENLITISQLSLVDLAGSERSSRTKNTGARLRETGNINNSLMKLRECLEYLRENQQAATGNNAKKIPYRDSKLTYLFKNFFEGEGQVSMIVCINPNAKDSVENAKVLKFAEMTQDVQIVKTKPIALSTPLKRQAWNKEHTEQLETIIKTPCNYNECIEQKIKPVSSVRKPIHYNQSMDTLKPVSNEFNPELDCNHKKIRILEKQNFELRLELTRIRDAYEKITGRSWCNDYSQRAPSNIFATVRKPLLACQKFNICENKKQSQSLRKQVTNVEGSVLSTKALGDAFQSELKLKLQKQREKLEESLIETMDKCEKARRSLFFDTDSKSFVIESIESNENKENEKLKSDTKIDSHEERLEVNIKDTPNNNLAIVFASFQLKTPKMKSKAQKCSTPKEHTLSSSKRQLNFCNENITPQSCKSFLKNFSFERDPDFDKRELELSQKMENHRNNQRENKVLMDILSSARPMKNSTYLFHKSFTKKNLFPKEHKQDSYSDAET